MMNHPLYPKRCDIDDPHYENICPFFEKLKTPTPDYEDPSDISEEILKKRLVWYWFNNKAKLITLVEANIEFCNGKPKNPVKTGIKGRGILSKFGPQHAADPVVTCWFDNRLYFVGILREDVNEWAIPGGFVDPGEDYIKTLQREFEEETCEGEDKSILDEIFSNGEIIYAGSVFNDPRTTDNAWIETIVVHYHIEEKLANKIKLVPQSGETKCVKWVECNKKLYGDHSKYLEIITDKMYYKKLISYSNNKVNYSIFLNIGLVMIYLISLVLIMYYSIQVNNTIKVEEKLLDLDCFMSKMNNPIIINKYCEN